MNSDFNPPCDSCGEEIDCPAVGCPCLGRKEGRNISVWVVMTTGGGFRCVFDNPDTARGCAQAMADSEFYKQPVSIMEFRLNELSVALNTEWIVPTESLFRP